MTEDCYRLLYDIASKRAEKLEEENAKLKEANETLYTMNNNMWVELEEKRAESQGITNRLHQLIEAKDLLNEFMRISKASDEDFEHDYSELIGVTEQFLKEIEK